MSTNISHVIQKTSQVHDLVDFERQVRPQSPQSPDYNARTVLASQLSVLRCRLDDRNAVAGHNRGVASLVDAQLAALPKIPHCHRSKALRCECGPRNADIGDLNREVQEHECECTIAQGFGEDLRAVTEIHNRALDAPWVLPQQQQHCSVVCITGENFSLPASHPSYYDAVYLHTRTCADSSRQDLVDSEQFCVREVRQGRLGELPNVAPQHGRCRHNHEEHIRGLLLLQRHSLVVMCTNNSTAFFSHATPQVPSEVPCTRGLEELSASIVLQDVVDSACPRILHVVARVPGMRNLWACAPHERQSER